MTVKELIIPIRTDISKMTAGYDKAMAKTRKLQQDMHHMGTKFLRYGAVMTGVGVIAVKTFGNFEQGLNEINSLLDKSDEKHLKKYKESILDLSKKYGEGTKTITKGLYDIISAGIDAAKATDVLEASIITAKAGLTDTGVAADAITTIWNSYAGEVKSAADISDLLFSIVKKGKTTMGELAPSIGMVASLASSAGLNMDDLGASLATMTAAGLNTRIAITSLKGILTTFLKPQQDAIEVARKYGIELNSQTLKTIGLGGVLEKLKNARQEDIAVIFSNVRALTGVSAMLKNTTKYTENYTAMVNRGGAAQKAFEKVAKGVNFRMSVMWAKVKVLAIIMGEKLVPTFNKVTATIERLTGKISNLSNAQLSSIANWIVLATKITLVAGTILVLVPKIIDLIKYTKILMSVMVAHPIIAVAAAIGILTMAISKNIAEQDKAASRYASMQGRYDDLARMTKRLKLLETEYAENNSEQTLKVIENLRMKIAGMRKFIEITEEQKNKSTEATGIELTLAQEAAEQKRMISEKYFEDMILATKNAADRIKLIEKKRLSDLAAAFKSFSDGIANAWAGSLSKFVIEGGKASDAIKNIWTDIRNHVINMIAQMIARWLTFQALTAAFGPGGGIMGKLMGFAGGVTNFRGGMALVGEQGQEIVNLPPGSDVISAPQTRRILDNTTPSKTFITNINNDLSGAVFTEGKIEDTLKRITEATKDGVIEADEMVRAVNSRASDIGSEA